MNLKINPNNLGKCYELSLQFVLSHPDWKLVHGYVTNRHPPSQTIDHAWVQKDNIIRDVIFEEDFTVDLFNILFSPNIIRQYTFNETISKMNEFETYGPWHEVKRYNPEYYTEDGKLKSKYKRMKEESETEMGNARE